jgi:hypothetical protein
MSFKTRSLIVLLLLQFHGWDGARPALALIPRPSPERMPERLVLPLALQHRRQVLAQIEFLAQSRACPLPAPAGPVPHRSPATDSPQPSGGGTDLLYALMSLQR